ncbi:MAG: hypothetical protein IJP61_03620, partial [Treponema sp.]|nr:hypothetical protein [Treponema sp.]
KCALPEKTGLSARCRVSGICLSRFAPSHPASAPSPSAFLHAAHFLCRIADWECGPTQPELAIRSAILRGSPTKPESALSPKLRTSLLDNQYILILYFICTRGMGGLPPSSTGQKAGLFDSGGCYESI